MQFSGSEKSKGAGKPAPYFCSHHAVFIGLATQMPKFRTSRSPALTSVTWCLCLLGSNILKRRQLTMKCSQSNSPPSSATRNKNCTRHKRPVAKRSVFRKLNLASELCTRVHLCSDVSSSSGTRVIMPRMRAGTTGNRHTLTTTS
jgi:hypothetical protein